MDHRDLAVRMGPGVEIESDIGYGDDPPDLILIGMIGIAPLDRPRRWIRDEGEGKTSVILGYPAIAVIRIGRPQAGHDCEEHKERPEPGEDSEDDGPLGSVPPVAADKE